jgi:hypothetical protein
VVIKSARPHQHNAIRNEGIRYLKHRLIGGGGGGEEEEEEVLDSNERDHRNEKNREAEIDHLLV